MTSLHPEYHNQTYGSEVATAFSEKIAGKIFLITGPSPSTIGASTAAVLSKHKPAAIVLAGRNPAKFQSVVDGIKANDANVKVITVVIELGSFASVRKAAKEILENNEIPRIDVLVNNAGIMGVPFALTVDGIESTFAVCHLGHFLLTNLIMPKLKAAPNPTVVNVSSGGHRFFVGGFDDYNFKKQPYEVFKGYGQGKAGNLLLSVSLASRGIRSISLTPGLVQGTSLGAHFRPKDKKEIFRLCKLYVTENLTVKNQDQGTATTLVAALDPVIPNGCYLSDCQPFPGDPRAMDPELAERLWKLSNELTGEAFA